MGTKRDCDAHMTPAREAAAVLRRAADDALRALEVTRYIEVRDDDQDSLADIRLLLLAVAQRNRIAVAPARDVHYCYEQDEEVTMVTGGSPRAGARGGQRNSVTEKGR